jgi:DNA topoisomerase-1
MRMPDQMSENPLPPPDAAEVAGLVYVNEVQSGISRRRCGKGFCYHDAKGVLVKDPRTLDRIRKLAIPPAYKQVWISPDPRGHIQATGRDARGRKQYRYHARFRESRDSAKYDRLLVFADALPGIRAAVNGQMTRRGLPREKVLATIVRLLDLTLIRVGNPDYARQNKTYGLTTLRDRHVVVNGSELRFQFKGKSGKIWRLKVTDRRIARIVRACQDLPGQQLFQYRDEDGQRQSITSTDINDYLRTVSGQDVTAKDFRTWSGTVMVAAMLAQMERPDAKTVLEGNVRLAIKAVAERLGNTPAICRKCYVHPAIIEAYLEGRLNMPAPAPEATEAEAAGKGLTRAEEAVRALLRSAPADRG